MQCWVSFLDHSWHPWKRGARRAEKPSIPVFSGSMPNSADLDLTNLHGCAHIIVLGRVATTFLIMIIQAVHQYKSIKALLVKKGRYIFSFVVLWPASCRRPRGKLPLLLYRFLYRCCNRVNAGHPGYCRAPPIFIFASVACKGIFILCARITE